MTTSDLNKYRNVLQAKQAELLHMIRNRDGIVIEKCPDSLDEVQYATERELAQARALRDALRRLAGYVTRDTRPAAASAMTDVAAALDLVNATAAEVPAPRLVLLDGRLEPGTHQGPSPAATGLARVAEQAVALFGGEEAGRLRACYAPGCVLYFVKTHPRRAWCSVACGNRVRAARHYQRVREHKDDA